jgi:hypothetical protein
MNGFDTTYQVIGEEELDLPAGKIKAWKIVCGTVYSAAHKVTVTNWLAEGIGLVKMENITIYDKDKSAVCLELRGYRVNGKKGGFDVPDDYVKNNFIDKEDNPYLTEMKEYFPMEKGVVKTYKETMQLGKEINTFQNIYEVAGYKIVDGRESLAIVQALGSQGFVPVEDYYFIEGETIYKIGRASVRKGQKVPVLKFPLKPGTKWALKNDLIEETSVVKNLEDVQTPAGKFKAVRIETTAKSLNAMHSGGTAIFWYAKGAGLVKSISTSKFPGAPEVKITQVLEKIQSGRDNE